MSQLDKLYKEALQNRTSGVVIDTPWGEQAFESQEEADAFLAEQGVTDHDQWKSTWGMGGG